MDQLPPELLSHIAALCDYKAKLQFCSVDRYLRDVLSPLAFEHIYVGWNLHHMEHITRLSKSMLRKHVRCVTVNTEILPPLKKRRWLECLYYTEAHEGNMAGAAEDPDLAWIYNRLLQLYSEDVLEAEWKVFQNVAADQQLWGHYIGNLLGTALLSLPKVEHLEFIDKRGIHVAEGGCICEPLVLCSPWKNLLLDSLKYNDLLISDWRDCEIPPDTADVSSAFAWHHVADWDGALKRRWPPGYISCVKELTLEFGHHIPVSTVFETTSCESCDSCGVRTPKSAAFKRVFETFPNLDRVNIKVSGNQLQHEEAVCKEIVSGLSKATNLRRLTIDSCQTDCDFLRAFMGRRSVWPLLEYLRLSGVTSADHLLNFFSSTAESLRVLELVELRLTIQDGIEAEPARWDDCLERVQQISQLESANICSLHSKNTDPRTVFFAASGFKSEMHRTVESFLTGGVQVLPRQETWDAVDNGIPLDS